MKKQLLILLLITSSVLFAQDYKFISKDLHKMSDQEMNDSRAQISSDTPLYTAKGEIIAPDQIGNIMASGNFFPVVFGDKDHIVKAVVFRAATKEETEAFRRMQEMQDPNANFVPGLKATTFTAFDIEGSKIDLNTLKGKVVVLNFWFTSCQPCVIEMPDLNALAKKYKGKATFISITFDSKEKVTSFLTNHTFNYTHIAANETIINDYKVIGFPTHILIDQNGEIVLRKVGNFVKALDEKLDLLLKQ